MTEMRQLVPEEVLDRALAQAPGVGEPIEFRSPTERNQFRWRLYAAMSADARRSRREDDGAALGWGKHRWGAVRTERLGATALWVGRALPAMVGASMTLDEARAAGQDSSGGAVLPEEEDEDGNE